ncbi:MAG: hypothetical protein R3F48_04455 [Candidatus Zixiibacteriota bacterium]
MTQSFSRAKQTKEEIKVHLRNRDIDAVIAWAKTVRNPLRTLASLLFEEDPLICWRAIEAIGPVAKIVAEDNEEQTAKQIQKFLWMMNDESGGLCRRGPEAIAEILVHVPSLIPRFVQILPSYLWEEPFERGTRLALYRLFTTRPETTKMVCGCLGDLLKSLNHEDDGIRAYSLLLLRKTNECIACPTADLPDVKPAVAPWYDFDSGELTEIKIP